jgi:hypothetical protein
LNRPGTWFGEGAPKNTCSGRMPKANWAAPAHNKKARTNAGPSREMERLRGSGLAWSTSGPVPFRGLEECESGDSRCGDRDWQREGGLAKGEPQPDAKDGCEGHLAQAEERGGGAGPVRERPHGGRHGLRHGEPDADRVERHRPGDRKGRRHAERHERQHEHAAERQGRDAEPDRAVKAEPPHHLLRQEGAGHKADHHEGKGEGIGEFAQAVEALEHEGRARDEGEEPAIGQ